MSFQDIFKSSFLENVTSVSFLDMALALILAFGVGLFLRLSQRTLCRGVRRFLLPGGLPAEAGDQQAA